MVQLTRELDQELDYEQIDIDEAVNRRSYISWEKIELESDLEWNES